MPGGGGGGAPSQALICHPRFRVVYKSGGGESRPGTCLDGVLNFVFWLEEKLEMIWTRLFTGSVLIRNAQRQGKERRLHTERVL